jgi:hypothetical protein
MPPHAFASHASTVRRQEACALSCLATTPVEACADAACFCASSSWGPLVLVGLSPCVLTRPTAPAADCHRLPLQTCLRSSCETEAALDYAYGQLLQYCRAAVRPPTTPIIGVIR